MKRQVVSGLVLGLAIAACNDQTPSSPRGPSNATVSKASPSPTDCNFNGLNSLIAQYFTNSTTQQAAKADVGLMQTAGPQKDAAIEPGFGVMGLIAGAVDGGSAGPPSTGATLTAELIKCMFTPTAVNRTFLSDTATPAFGTALDPAKNGAYEVRGPNDGYSVIRSRPTGAPISAIAPIRTVAGLTPWSQILDTVPETSHSVLVYGHDIPNTAGYDWALIQPDANFKSPYAVVALCTATDPDSSAMVKESSVGVLGYVTTSICTSDVLGALQRQGGPFALLKRIARFGGELLEPEPLHATVATLTGSTIGGSAGGAKSQFTPTTVASVTLTFSPVATPVTVSPATFPAQVQATASGTGINGVCVAITGTNNNGTPTSVRGAHNCDAGVPDTIPTSATATVGNVAGIATFSLSVTKTGGLTLVANGVVLGRPGIAPAQAAFSNKINVKP